MSRKISLSALSLALISSAAFADPHFVVAPTCLTNQVHAAQTTLASDAKLTFIKTDEAGIEQLIKAKQKHTATPCGGFMDVTESWQKQHQSAAKFLSSYSQPKAALLQKNDYKIQYNKQVNDLISTMNPQNMWTDLTTMTSFPTRYAASEDGIKTAKWIQTQVENMAKEANRTDVTFRTVETGKRYTQPSVVVKIGNGDKPGVVIGGHMDTLSTWWGTMPGADDDGSGSVTVLELARVLLTSGMEFKKPIYLVWYAAEEEGLYGSQAVVADFKEKKIAVDSVLQLDMTGYTKDLTMWLIKDYTNADLTKYLEQLITTYVKKPVKYTQCGYACSDHASWTEGGFISAFPVETAFGDDNPDIHTANDTMEKLSLEHMTSYEKLAIAFAVERAEPVTKG
ncbi:MAG: M20/M25/M40 family metallo-hydrolase [Gammaproteobacteria bacterium]